MFTFCEISLFQRPKGIENYVEKYENPVDEHFWTFKMELIFISLIHNKLETIIRKYELQR